MLDPVLFYTTLCYFKQHKSVLACVRACVRAHHLPPDGQRQVLHLGILLFDLLDETKQNFLQLREEPRLVHTDVLVQCRH